MPEPKPPGLVQAMPVEVSLHSDVEDVQKQISGASSEEPLTSEDVDDREDNEDKQEQVKSDDLDETHQEVLSLGSMKHELGSCLPCAWFWKPSGCHHGLNCNRCHVCPPGELKIRKKAKILKLREAAKAEADDTADERPIQVPLPPLLPPLEVASELRQGHLAGICVVPISTERSTTTSSTASTPRAQAPLFFAPRFAPPREAAPPSLGSLLHATGRCSPCAWFWKLEGCQSGPQCGRCHLCPAGEVKARKKAKVQTLRATRPEAAAALLLDLL